MGSLRMWEGRLHSERAGPLSKRADNGRTYGGGRPTQQRAAGACTQPRLCLILASASRFPCFLLLNTTMKGSGGKSGGLVRGKCCHTKPSFRLCEFCYYQQDAVRQSCGHWSEVSFVGKCIRASLFVSPSPSLGGHYLKAATTFSLSSKGKP